MEGGGGKGGEWREMKGIFDCCAPTRYQMMDAPLHGSLDSLHPIPKLHFQCRMAKHHICV